MTVEELQEKLSTLDPAMLHASSFHAPSKASELDKILRSLAVEMGRDAALADELYSNQNYVMRLLATYIDDPEAYTRDELKRRAEQLENEAIAEVFCERVMAHTPYAVQFIDEWTHCNDKDFNCLAYYTLAEVARRKNNLSADFYSRHIEEIAERINEKPEVVQKAMREALQAISKRDAKLKEACKQLSASLQAVHF